MEIYQDDLFVEMYSRHEGHLHGIKQVLIRMNTDYQQLEIVDTYEYGRCLLLDGKMQSSQADEYIYHEFLVHPAMLTHPCPRSILIIGGGEGATLREVLRHPCVERVEMVEIDAQVIEFAKAHLPEWHQGAFADGRVHLIVADGREYLNQTAHAYDVIINDVSDPGAEGPACLLYTREFYQTVSRRLSAGGLLALQAGSSSVVSGEIMASIYKTLQSVFPVVYAYEAAIPSFDLPWRFCLASVKWDPLQLTPEMLQQRLEERKLHQLRAYDADTQAGLFHISKALRTVLANQGRIIHDQKPIFTPL